ncbi:MAG: HEAT repeat domain-containing protein [Chloroflexi bacterium]|nr:HEAT repeat domain-containing protein [Chloroflexota bacterium]
MAHLQDTNAGADIPQLISQLGSEDESTRDRARRSLVETGQPAVQALIKAMASDNLRVRWQAAKALGELADPTAAPSLLAALQDPVFDVRWLAVEGLIALGGRAAEPTLRMIVQHADIMAVRDGAHHILNHLAMTDKDEHHVLDHPAPRESDLRHVLPPVIEALQGPDAAVKAPVAAAEALDALRQRKGNR